MDDYVLTITVEIQRATGNYRWDRSDVTKRELEFHGPLSSFEHLVLGDSINALWRVALDEAAASVPPEEAT